MKNRVKNAVAVGIEVVCLHFRKLTLLLIFIDRVSNGLNSPVPPRILEIFLNDLLEDVLFPFQVFWTPIEGYA